MSETTDTAVWAPAGMSPGSARKRRKPPADYGPVQVLRRTGLAAWQWAEAVDAGMIPAADVDGRWSAAVADEVAGRRDAIVAATGTDGPVGGHKAADRLAGRAGLAVDKRDVEALADAGLLRTHGWYKEWPLYSCRDLDAVDAGQLAPIVAERQAWMAASVHASQAPGYLGWRREELDRVREQRGLRPGRYGRYARADLDALAGDEELAGQLHADRLLMTHQGAAHLEIRETDFRYLIAADLAVPHTHTTVDITRYRSVSVPLYRTGDLDALREHPGIDWEAVRAVPASRRRCASWPGARSTGPP